MFETNKHASDQHCLIFKVCVTGVFSLFPYPLVLFDILNYLLLVSVSIFICFLF